MRSSLLKYGLVLVLCSAAGVVRGQDEIASAGESADLAAQIAELRAATEEASLAGHNAWMLVSCALVLFMTAPGLAMFYGGLVRKKNVVGVMMQCIFLMGLMTVIWALWGYTLAFGGSGRFVGDMEFLMMNNVQSSLTDAGPVIPMEGLIPRPTHMLFPRHVLYHHAGIDLRCIRRTNAFLHDGSVHGSLGDIRLLPVVPLGVGRRFAGLRSGLGNSGWGIGFCRRDRGPHQLGCLRIDLRISAREAFRIRF